MVRPSNFCRGNLTAWKNQNDCGVAASPILSESGFTGLQDYRMSRIAGRQWNPKTLICLIQTIFLQLS